jgi:spoIIIJ-associated protein
MEDLEISAKTVEEAIQKALDQLNVERNRVEVEVLKKGRSGILGLKGEEARIKVRLLHEEENAKPEDDVGRVGQEVLKKMLGLMGITAEVEVMKMDGPVTLNIEGDDLGILIGRRGQTLSSLQYIVKVIVSEKLKVWLPLNVDVDGYKRRRYQALESLALRLAEKVKTSRRTISLEPMPPDERRIVHITLANDADVSTQSTGEGEERKVVIQLKKK